MKHCQDYWEDIWLRSEDNTSWEEFIQTTEFRKQHHTWSCSRELHAEMNAILQCKMDISESTIYTLLSPCINCDPTI